MNAFKLVFQYSLLEKIKSKGFFITTLIAILILAAVVFLPEVYDKMTADAKKEVYVINEIEGLPLSSETLAENVSEDYKWNITEIKKEEDFIQSINNEEEILLMKVSQENSAAPIVEVTSNNMNQWPFIDLFVNYIQSMYTMQTIQSLNLTMEQATELTTPINVKIDEVSERKEGSEQNYLIVYLTLFMLYLLIMNFGATVGTSIAVEKGSRIKEVLITKVKPVYLLAGKICGVGTAGLIQFGMIVLFILIFLKLSSNNKTELFGINFDLTVVGGSTLFYILLFFILGYVMYSALYAAIGALVSRAEEINQATIPVSLLMMAGFLIAYFSGMTNPDSQMIQVLSYVPFFTPFIMITRIVLTNLSTMEILLPTVTLVAFIILTCVAAARIYKAGVLIYGKKINMKMLLNSMKQM